MSFFEVEFPKAVSFGAVGGSTFFTNVNYGLSGFEQRNRNWARTRGKWAISVSTPADMDDERQNFIELVQAFFLVVGAMADGFRFKDWTDYKATNQEMQEITPGSVYQLQRTYSIAGRSYVRTITKPVTAAVKDYRGNNLVNTVVIKQGASTISASNYTVNHENGRVTFTGGLSMDSPFVPPTADFEYHFPARFNTDELNMRAIASDMAGGKGIVRIDSVEIVEIRI